MTRSKDIGTSFTTDVIRFLHTAGWPSAELRNQAGEHDKGDIIGCPGIVIECKGGKAAETASDNQILAWLAETEKERVNAGADIGVLVTKRKAVGARNAGQWAAWMPLWQVGRFASCRECDWTSEAPVRLHLADACALLRAAGYGSAAA